MKRAHFERLAPRCPVCGGGALTVLREARGSAAVLDEGVLCCTASECRHEFPVIDGLALLVRELRSHLAEHSGEILARDDLDETTESLLGDACGPGSSYDALRQHVSNYSWDHWGEFDPAEQERDPAPGSIARVLAALLPRADALPQGPALDLGCSVGRASFELARLTGRDVLGVDLHHAKLRVAARVLREGRVVYARRRLGLVYERRAFDVQLAGAERVDFWSADAAALPFADASFALVACLNLLDCAREPLSVLRECQRVLRPGGALLLACPYDWSASATPVEAWIGGHSQRGTYGGASEPLLRALLTPGAHPQSLGALELRSELDGLDWHVRLHDRSSMRYRVHGLVARKCPG